MSLLFKRQQNIEENNKILESLGFFTSSLLGVSPSTKTTKVESSSTPRTITQEFSLSNFRGNFFPSRITQASDLYTHLSIDTSFPPFPALVTGPPGCGKSSITREILSQLALPASGAAHPRIIAHVRCHVYKDTKSFLVGLWSIMGESYMEFLSNRRAEGRHVPTTLTASLFDRLPIPKNFGELCVALRKFLLEVSQKLDIGKVNTSSSSSSSSSSHTIRGGNSNSNSSDHNGAAQSRLGSGAGLRPVYLQLDHVDALDGLETGLTQLVLDLPKLSYSGLRIVGTCASLPSHLDTQQGLLLRLAPYTTPQLAEILRFKLKKQFDTDLVGHAGKVIVSPGTSVSRNGNHSSSSSGVVTASNQMLHNLLAVVEHGMHHLVVYSTHIDVLYQLVLSVHNILHTEVVNAVADANVDQSGRSGAQIEFTHTQIENAVRIVLGSSDRPDATSTNGAATKESSIVGDGTALGTALAERERLRAQSVWLKSMPLGLKYLVVAVFLAAANPKDSDAFTFGTSSRGKRKLTHNDFGRAGNKTKRRGGDADDIDDPTLSVSAPSTHNRNKSKKSSSTQYSSFADSAIEEEGVEEVAGRDSNSGQNAAEKKEFSQSVSRKFTLERVFGIMGQVACHCGVHVLNGGEQAARALGRSVGMIDVGMTVEQVSSSYGGCHLFSLMKLLVEQNLVGVSSQSGAWVLTGAAQFHSRVPRDMADAIAASLCFPLRDFIHHED